MKPDTSPRRMCSACGDSYTDASGHNLKTCVEVCRKRVKAYQKSLIYVESRLALAKDRLRRSQSRKAT